MRLLPWSLRPAGWQHQAAPTQHVIAAERFEGCPNLAAVRVPLDAGTLGGAGLDVVIVRHGTQDWRRAAVPPGALDGLQDGTAPVGFVPFDNGDAADFDLILARGADGMPTQDLIAAAAALGARPLITVPCSSAALEAAPVPALDPPPEPDFTMGIEWFWIDRQGLFLRGWMHAFSVPVLSAVIEAGASPADVVLRTDRPDVQAFFPEWNVALKCGFHVYAPWQPGSPVRLTVETGAGTVRRTLDLPARAPDPVDVAGQEVHSNAVLTRFAQAVNDGALVVAEIGGRRVSDGWIDNRARMSRAMRYIGVDIHPGPGVDVVGDAHALDALLGRGSIDAAYSLSVLEHLAQPWLFAASLNRALRPGGLTLHVTHQSWPLHEEPNDFWRYSDEALRVLFGPDFGFEVIEAGMGNKVAIHPELRPEAQWMMPLISAYGASFVLARKVRDLPDGPALPGGDSRQSRRYPVRSADYDPYSHSA